MWVYTLAMRIQLIALTVLALSLAPVAAMACEEEVTAVQPTPVVKLEVAVKALQRACVVLQQSCVTAITVQGDETMRVVPAGTRRPDWEPGHLIDRDSLRAVPEPDNQQPETWVKVSNRNSFSWRFSYKNSKDSKDWKKAKGRVVTAPGPRRS